MTVLKDGSTLTTGTGVGDTSPGISIHFASGHGAGQNSWLCDDYLGALIWGVGDPAVLSGAASLVWGDFQRAFHAAAQAGVGFDGVSSNVLGIRTPACAVFPDAVSSIGSRMWAGTGAPSTSTIGGPASIGDLYVRRDGSAGTRLYRCSVASAAVSGDAGTWVAVA